MGTRSATRFSTWLSNNPTGLRDRFGWKSACDSNGTFARTAFACEAQSGRVPRVSARQHHPSQVNYCGRQAGANGIHTTAFWRAASPNHWALSFGIQAESLGGCLAAPAAANGYQVVHRDDQIAEHGQ